MCKKKILPSVSQVFMMNLKQQQDNETPAKSRSALSYSSITNNSIYKQNHEKNIEDAHESYSEGVTAGRDQRDNRMLEIWCLYSKSLLKLLKLAPSNFK